MLFIVFLDSKTVKTYKNLGFVANYIQKPIKTYGFLQFLTLGVWFVVPEPMVFFNFGLWEYGLWGPQNPPGWPPDQI